MARLSHIPQKLIDSTVAIDDLNKALGDFQDALGIVDGDVAGNVFACGWNDEWPTATRERRLQMMEHYIRAERFYARR